MLQIDDDLGMHRLYAIDVVREMVNIISVKWYVNFERMDHPGRAQTSDARPRSEPVSDTKPRSESISSLKDTKRYATRVSRTLEKLLRHRGVQNSNFGGKLRPNRYTRQMMRQSQRNRSHYVRQMEQPQMHRSRVEQLLPGTKHDNRGVDSGGQSTSILYNDDLSAIYVSLPHQDPTLWALKDEGHEASLMFKVSHDVSDLSMYELSVPANRAHPRQSTTVAQEQLWASVGKKGEITGIDASNGSVLQTINVSAILHVSRVYITSKVMVAKRKDDDAGDILIFGVKLDSGRTPRFNALYNGYGIFNTDVTSFVLAVDASQADDTQPKLMWMLHVPHNAEVVGQIISVPLSVSGDRNQKKDSLVAFGQINDLKQSIIFSIH
jgi:hypothetical protein